MMNETRYGPDEYHHDDHDAHLLRCWRIQNCGGCLEEPDCSWCPFSWTCVPNSYRAAFFAPAWDENICPHWAERWEIRTRPLGCQVSTITTLTSLVTIASTLLFVLLVALAVTGGKRLRVYGRKNPGWWRVWRYDWRGGWSRLVASCRVRVRGRKRDADLQEAESSGRQAGEREPLLPSARDTGIR
ncbi:hypothetical protein F4778DRAFT_107252 [Xylariomycetidae sp. FL2044]|nr:hypothetical protein F4778DRAFT_107252 [Xylariomycetidae sp. FL2044]